MDATKPSSTARPEPGLHNHLQVARQYLGGKLARHSAHNRSIPIDENGLRQRCYAVSIYAQRFVIAQYTTSSFKRITLDKGLCNSAPHAWGVHDERKSHLLLEAVILGFSYEISGAFHFFCM
jgi:hypothetical protein